MSAKTNPTGNGVEASSHQETHRPSETGPASRTLRLGVEGGTIATAVMTLFRMPITDSLPPTAQFWATYVGTGDPDDYPVQALLLHFLYGIGAATAFTAAVGSRLRGSEVHQERQGTLWATLYALVLSVFGTQVIFQRLLGMNLDPDERWIFHVSHAIYGLTLGAWLGSNVEFE
ncbi:hypothetical protein ACFR9U_01455 [Halorientalis brevis]|uniref:DUF2231 domain-containing protein n=1 Tax=Halorientalis brevis TaxID=1126241 RepID=A0ABD6C793_9EURY|nr:hypothetical protein [Halorientalis brevis]